MRYSRIQDYHRKVSAGYQTMNHSTVAICAIVRDCENALQRNIPQVEKLRSYFSESFVIVVENDSKDNTKSVLKTWSEQSNNVHVLSEDLGVQTIPRPSKTQRKPLFSKHRMDLMVSYRNKYLEFLEQNFEVDYMIVIDLDLHSISVEGVVNTFGQAIPWHAVTSNSRIKHRISEFYKGYHYYDTYALREVGDERVQTEEMIYAYQNMLKPLCLGMPMLRVASAFGGLGVYKSEAIKGLRYTCKENEDEYVEVECDCVPFHKDMAKNGYGLIFINPSQVVYYDTFSNFLREKLLHGYNYLRFQFNEIINLDK